jgi:general secretion pathway protein K
MTRVEHTQHTSRDPRSGVVLAMVLILGLLLSTAVVSFSSRAMIDGMISRNRDRAARAEALARGGIQVAIGLILEDALEDAEGAQEGGSGGSDTLDDVWARIADTELVTEQGDTLRVHISDTGSRLNLNSLVDYSNTDGGLGDQKDAEEFLNKFLKKVIDDMAIPPGEKFYEPRELGRNLLDYLDPDDIRGAGGDEDDYYRRQTPPYGAANRPMLSIDELGMIEGFDAKLVRALTPYVTVYPPVNAQGINLNTAPPHVLTAVYHGTSGDRRLIKDDDVERILKKRDEGKIICDQTQVDPDRCVPLGEMLDGTLYPESQLPASSKVFTVVAEARVGKISRSLEAVIDRSNPAQPRVLTWRYR